MSDENEKTQPEFLTVEEAASVLRVNRKTVLRAVHERPLPIFTFSRVGVSNDLTEAMVYEGFQRDWLDGQGTLFILKRDGDRGRSSTRWCSGCRDHGREDESRLEPDLLSRERLTSRADSRRHAARLRGTGVLARERLGTCHASGFDWAFSGEDARATIPIISKVELGLRGPARAKTRRFFNRMPAECTGHHAALLGNAPAALCCQRCRKARSAASFFSSAVNGGDGSSW